MATKKDQRRLDLGKATTRIYGLLWVLRDSAMLTFSGVRSLLAIPYVEPPKDKNDADMTGTD